MKTRLNPLENLPHNSRPAEQVRPEIAIIKNSKVVFTILCLAFVPWLAWSQQPTQPAPTKAASPAKSKITNADVIQLVTAGLSEQVIIVSIRQASERDFDLTPTGLVALKKAGVPDAVILVMQNGDAAVKPAAQSDDKAPKDDTVSGIKDYLQKRVTAESQGAITLSSFARVNGYEQELTKLYVLEWQAEILFQQEGWKLGDFFVGYWKDFQIFLQNPKSGGLNDLLLAASGKGDAKHFNKGTKIRLTGDCMLRKTEQGWRTEEFTVKTTQVLAEGGPTEPSPSATAPVPATTEPVSLEALSETIARGEEAVVNFKYNSAIPGYLYLANGKVKVSKTAVAFEFTYGLENFTVSPDKILDVVNEPQQNKRIHIKAAVKNKKGNKESTKDFYFYSLAAVAVGTGPGGAGGSISCNACDDSMSVLYALLQKVRRAGDESKLPSVSSMKEAAAWIKREFPLLGAFSEVVTKNDDPSKPLTHKYGIESAVLSDGRLSIRRTDFMGENLRLTYTETVTLKDVDVSKIRAFEQPSSTGFTHSPPSYIVQLIAVADRGEPFTSQMKQEGFPAREIKPTRMVRVRTGDKEAANRAADVLRRAAVLCGAVETAVAEPAQSQLTAEKIQDMVTKSTAGQFASPLAEKTLSEFLVAESTKTGVPVWLVVAQAKRETSFGSPQNGTVQDGRTFKDGTKGNAHNLFNIRPGSSWTGKILDLGTGSGEFRVYDSYEDSVRDYMRLMSSSLYKGLTLNATVYKYFPPSDNGGSAATERYIDSMIDFAASQGVTITRDTVVVP